MRPVRRARVFKIVAKASESSTKAREMAYLQKLKLKPKPKPQLD